MNRVYFAAQLLNYIVESNYLVIMDNKTKAKNKIEEICRNLNNEGFEISLLSEKQYNFEIDISAGKEKVKVLVYFGKKGVRTVLQGNQDLSLYKDVEKNIYDEMKLDFPEKVLSEPESYIGSDESGKGDIFGPLVTAAVYVDKDTSRYLERMGVRDSKELSDNKIAELTKLIEQAVQDNFEVILITPAKYNELYDKFHNLNKMLNWSHSKAIGNLLARVNCATVITDKFENRMLEISRTGIGHDVEFIQTPKAEKYTAVAAASILARNTFNKWFINQRKKGYNLLKGASTEVSKKAAAILKDQGPKTLETIAKMHFKTIKKITL